MRPDRSLALLGLLAAALAVGCARSPDRTPRLAGLTPGGGPADAPLQVTVRGQGFFPRTVQSASGGPSAIDTAQRAWLDGVELASVTWVDTATLRLTIPAGLALGPHDLAVENGLGLRGTLAGAWTVLDPAVLAATARLSASAASTSQVVSLTVTVSNSGGTTVGGLGLTVTPQGGGSVTVGAPPPPALVGPGGSAELSVDLTALTPGAVTLEVAVLGVEAVSGRSVGASASAGTLAVQSRAALEASLAIPATIAAAGGFTVTMIVFNGGDATARNVVPDALTLAAGSTGTLASLSGPSPARADIAGQGSATFTWSARLQGPGTVQLQGGAAGQDGNDAGQVLAEPELSNLGGQAPEVTVVASDPLGDGSPAPALAARGGRLYLGPSADGRSLWRFDPATGLGETVGVEVAVDTGSSPAANLAWRSAPPATTFGAAGCATNSTACGPSNESLRGVLAGGTFSGSEWLLYAGASDLKARSLYLSAGDATPLAFQTVDLSAVLPTTTVAPTAVAFAPSSDGDSDRIYFATTDKSAKKSPYLVALSTAPTAPWLDAAMGTDAVELGVAGMLGLGGGASVIPNTDPVPRLDALLQFRGRIYLAGSNGVWRSTTATPRSYASHPSDWALATPPLWASPSSLPATASTGITPADRAVPAMVAFGRCGDGPCLFLARNVQGTAPAVVPQLLVCDPTGAGSDDACDPLGDWSLVVPDQGSKLTQLGVPTRGAVSVLLATSRFLYLGFDDAAAGAALYRTEVVPDHVSDFKGRDGCAAGTAGCVGLGGVGLGDASLTRFLDARAVTSGGLTTVYVLAGDGVGPARLFALPD